MRTRIPIAALDILRALDSSSGDVKAAAALLGVSYRTLYRRMKDYDIKVRREYRVEAA